MMPDGRAQSQPGPVQTSEAISRNQRAVALLDADFVCFRTYDIADEVNLETCLRLVRESGSFPERMELRREGKQYIELHNPPLRVGLGSHELLVQNVSRQVELRACFFEHGALSVSARLPVPQGSSFEELIPWVDELSDSPALEMLTNQTMLKLRMVVQAALKGSRTWEQNEAYTILLARKMEGQRGAEEILAEPNLARLLLGEVREASLSPAETREVLSYHFSYTPKDLAVIEWSAAFLFEPTGNEDLVDLLELANAQLLEFRLYDSVLDAELDRVYDTIEAKKSTSLLKLSPYKHLLRELMQTLIELSEFIERIENSLKVISDVYLARVYEAAVVQFRIKQWNEQVMRKQRLLQMTYNLLKGEVDNGRALTLEIMVVVLILVEIVMAIVRAER
jgi:hypothetical protein